MSRRRERGVAIITALVVVAAATVAVSAMMWRQSIAVRKVENRDALSEARWLARSAVEWSRLILLQDARTSAVDHLGELWAVPLAETRVTDDLAATQSTRTAPSSPASAPPFADTEAAWVSGRIVDAQARLNLAGLAANGKVDEARYATLARLVAVLDLREAVAARIAERMNVLQPPDGVDALARAYGTAEADDVQAMARLRPFVTILPVPSAVNANTAPAEVLAACIEDLPLDAARALVRSRDQAWFAQVADIGARLPGTSGRVGVNQVSVSTNWFDVAGRVRVGRAELEVTALLEREQNGTTRVRSLVER